MTIIWAKKIEGKRHIFSDDMITWWTNVKLSAAQNFRNKIRVLPRNERFLVAASGTCRQSDIIFNLLDKNLCKEEVQNLNKYELKDTIQDIIIDWAKTIKEVDNEDLAYWIIVLDRKTDTLYFIEEFCVNIIADNVELVKWAWEEIFYRLHKIESWIEWADKFIADISLSIIMNDFCCHPIYEACDNYVKSYDEDWTVLAKVSLPWFKKKKRKK